MEQKLTKSEAKALYWSRIPKEVRSAKAKAMAKQKASLMTTKERSEHAKKMIKARLEKRIIMKNNSPELL